MPKVTRAKLDKAEKIVRELMGKYHNCAQCTLVGIQRSTGSENEDLTKASTGFGGGIGGIQSTCGALTGGVLGLSLKYGRDASYLSGPVDAALKKQEEAIEQTARLVKWFEREFGSTLCAELRKSHMGTNLSLGVPWQNEWANQLKMRDRCTEFAAKTARRVVAMLDDPNLGLLED